ncbi:uncharacterized protein LOC116263583 [Nymphaea colorata]|uniref:uncharacterized protein LOC116263583 n=1 Tax=Nymphaea colorata TaxID=210225 RepID=UPI00129E89FB|nr:uncharacterized protein LOC116263583 [Nymphaea colorata]
MSFRGLGFFPFPALVIDLLLASTVVSNPNSTNFCSSPFNCSNSTPILFPFSSLNSSCGVNLISCNGNVTKIHLFNSDFIVKRITYLDRGLNVCYQDSYGTKRCSSPQNFSFSGRLLTSGFRLFGPKLTFFRCNSANDGLLQPPSSWKRNDCADGSLLYYYYSPQEQIKLPLDVHRINCPMYEIPAGVEESESANFSAILSGGFFLRWRFDCLKCTTSGGQCVFGEDDAPACYCEDGSVHHTNCSDGSSSKSAGSVIYS